ncbi:Hypothetical protein KNT65_gp011 [Escherichia phage EcS1]|uniref:Uncharacterized protein n=1 Tax=Escherichia phage EcS1 TaxID=2083276 RepID=A0A2Z5ZBV7_9CAUD|nr:Hypothetical protein KNT65_gp011 [Escherichia phage EcS1]BBC78059.1 Hypothetical protein [Escherichia phage EcS1]
MAKEFKLGARYALADVNGFINAHIYNKSASRLITENGTEFTVLHLDSMDNADHVLFVNGSAAGDVIGSIDHSFMLLDEEAKFFTELSEAQVEQSLDKSEMMFSVSNQEQAERAIKAITAAWLN